MPNIREFDAPRDLSLQPSDRAAEAVASSGRRIAGLYGQAAEATADIGRRAQGAIQDVGDVVVKFAESREISSGAAAGAKAIENLNNQWNQIAKTADPNDPSIAAKWREETLEPFLEQFKSGFTTENSQKWADQFANNYRTHMFQKTAADMSTLAGVAVRQNVEKTINSLSSAVASDPSSLDFALKSVDHSVGAMVDSSPTLDPGSAASIKGEIGLKAKENIVKAAISGMITKNPNIDLDAVQKKYGEFINGAEMKVFQRAAQVQAKSNALADKQAALVQRQLDDQKVHVGATKTIADNVTFDSQTGQPIINPKFFNQALDLARRNPDAPSAAATVRTMLDWGQSQQNKETKVYDDPAVKKELTDRLFNPDSPTTVIDLMRARAAGKISDHSFQVMDGLVKELAESPLRGPVYQDTMTAAHDALVVNVPGIPGKDTVGTIAYASFVQSFIPQYLAKSRAGTLPPNALDVKDPTSMISQAMAPFKRTPAQRMADYVAGAGGLTVTESGDVNGNVNRPASIPTVLTQQQFDGLPKGASYVGKDGKTYRKP